MELGSALSFLFVVSEKKKKRKDYAFRRQFNEKPSIIPGCPDICCVKLRAAYPL